MNSLELAPAGFYQFEGQSPDGKSRCQFIVAKDQFFGHLKDDKNRNKGLEALLLPQIAANPCGVWKDLKSPGKGNWLAYVGVPANRRIANIGIEIPWKEGMTFVFYVRELRGADGQLVIDHWELVEEADQTSPDNRPGFPINHKTRYGERLWPAD